MDEATARADRRLPDGRGAARRHGRPRRETLRLEDLTEHPLSVGFPAHHPPMQHAAPGADPGPRARSSAALPHREGRRASRSPSATSCSVQALATVAGFVIENARAYGAQRAAPSLAGDVRRAQRAAAAADHARRRARAGRPGGPRRLRARSPRRSSRCPTRASRSRPRSCGDAVRAQPRRAASCSTSRCARVVDDRRGRWSCRCATTASRCWRRCAPTWPCPGVLVLTRAGGGTRPRSRSASCWRPSPTRPRSPSTAPRRSRTASRWRSSPTATGSPATSTTWSSSGSSRTGLHMQSIRSAATERRAARRASTRASGSSTRPSATSAARSSSCRPGRAARCAPRSATWSASTSRCSASPRRCTPRARSTAPLEPEVQTQMVVGAARGAHQHRPARRAGSVSVDLQVTADPPAAQGHRQRPGHPRRPARARPAQRPPPRDAARRQPRPVAQRALRHDLRVERPAQPGGRRGAPTASRAEIVGRPTISQVSTLHVPAAPGPARHRLEPVRRPRRLDQHHAADPAVAGRGGGPPRAQPVGPGGRGRRDRGGRRRASRCRRTRAGTSSTSSTSCSRWPSAAPGTSRCTAAAAASSSPRRSSGSGPRGVTIFSPEDGQRLGLVGMVNQIIADCDIDLWAAGPTDRRGRRRRRPDRGGPRDHRRRGRAPRRGVPRAAAAAAAADARRCRCSASPAPAAPASPR